MTCNCRYCRKPKVIRINAQTYEQLEDLLHYYEDQAPGITADIKALLEANQTPDSCD